MHHSVYFIRFTLTLGGGFLEYKGEYESKRGTERKDVKGSYRAKSEYF